MISPDDEVFVKVDVLRMRDLQDNALEDLIHSYGLRIKFQALHEPIPGSYWGDTEAGLLANTLHVRPDTPVHSALHETCHYICMDEGRKVDLHTDAGGDYDEENAVCFLQIILADKLVQMGRQQMFQDMDAWGYTFRLGSAERWFREDAEDALDWLQQRGLIN